MEGLGIRYPAARKGPSAIQTRLPVRRHSRDLTLQKAGPTHAVGRSLMELQRCNQLADPGYC